MTQQTPRWKITAAADIQSTDFDQWQRLVDQHHSGNMMLSALFVSNLLRSFSQDHYLASCYLGNDITMMMVLRRRRFGIWELAQLAQAESALIVGAQQSSPDLNALIKVLPGLVLRLDFFCLDPLDHQGIIDALQHHSIRNMHQNIRIDCKQTFETYWQTRSKNLRKNIQRYRNRLDSENMALRFEVHTESSAIYNAVDRYGFLEASGWKGKSGTSLHPDNLQGKFYRNFLTESAENSNSLVIEFYINDQLAASRLCSYTSNIFIILKTSYDETLKCFAPGRLLLAEVIQYVIKNSIAATIDFYTHATEEQIEWATDIRPMYQGSYYRYKSYLKFRSALESLTKKDVHIEISK
jgi:CelD/BcsL family acetyltransferase involved in cellulose biosynthesis